MKKTIALILTGFMAAAALTGCSSSSSTETTAAGTSAEAESTQAESTEEAKEASGSELSGTVATDGSTSMEKVIGALGEAFMEANKGVTFTYNPTGSGSGIQAVQEGRCDIGLSSRALKDEEKKSGLKDAVSILKKIDDIAIIKLSSKDVVRHKLVQAIINAYERAEEQRTK